MKFFSYLSLAFTGLLTLMVLTSCSNNDPNDPKTGKLLPSAKMGAEFRSLQRVLSEDGQAIANAQILIGTAVDTPFKGNFLTTDQNGQFPVPEGWIAPQAVTISAPGFVRATYLAQSSGGQPFVLRKDGAHGNFELTGQTPGVNIVGGDGNAYFSLIVPVLQRNDILHFNLGMFLSPQKDEISVLGQTMSVPSNLTLPKQKQSYVLPFTLNKPIYRNYFETSGPKRVLALSGKFPFKKVVDKIRGGTPFYLISNDMQILSGGVTDASLVAPSTTSDIPANQFSINESRSFSSAAVGSGELLLGVALTNNKGDLVLTDVKVLTPNAQNALGVQSGNDVQLLSLLKKQSEMQSGPGEDRLSAVMLPFTSGATPQHLPLLENPRLMSNTTVQIQKIQVPGPLKALATYGSLQTLKRETLKDGSLLETPTQVWEVYASDWVDTIEIPLWPGDPAISTGNMRWSVALVAGAQQANVDLGPSLMQNVTHVTNTSIDF